MNTHKPAEELRANYLAELDRAIGPLPHYLAEELRAGIAEELSALTPAQLMERIAELGSPAEVASAALAADLPPRTAPSGPRPLSESRGFAIAALIVLGVGGLVLPAVGWIIGCVLVATSRLWRAGEKAWAILITPLSVALALAIGWAASSFGAAGVTEQANPLIPGMYFAVSTSVLFTALIVAPLSGLWLLLRLRSRHSPEDVPLA